jgi:hypothetical protein
MPKEQLSKKEMNRLIGRKPTAKNTEVHTPKNKYKRKKKYKEDYQTQKGEDE